ncbi:hypothetical protein FOZ62_014625 [Perkinsus olseni]|uniref:Uncharacterized protein n=1 Tax=Perkinsus olseni TaxID=32597 RepID=A0A7J6TNT3_PEROL|nr:hypothetical protein FOZ62_014625 [Perkinsus olseni]
MAQSPISIKQHVIHVQPRTGHVVSNMVDYEKYLLALIRGYYDDTTFAKLRTITVAIDDVYYYPNNDIIMGYFPTCALRCTQLQHNDACNCLANLCVMNLYTTTSTICSYFLSLSDAYEAANAEGSTNLEDDGGARSLYTNPLPSLFINSRLMIEPSLPAYTMVAGDELKLWVSTYDVNGTWLGWDRVDDGGAHVVTLCDQLAHTAPSWSIFGTTQVEARSKMHYTIVL